MSEVDVSIPIPDTGVDFKPSRDTLLSDAEIKKELVRKQIREIKNKYRGLKFRNSKLPDDFKLTREEFEIDQRIRVPLKEKLAFKFDEVHKKQEWENMRSIILADKIQQHFLEPIETHHIVVKDLYHTTEVSSFRCKSLSPGFLEASERNKILLEEERLVTGSASDFELSQATESIIEPKRFYAFDLIGEFDLQEFDIKTIHAIKHLEERLRKKHERESRWACLMSEKVPDNYEDPEDTNQLKLAKENLGDYKLKSRENYHGEKLTIAQRRQKIIDLKFKIHELMKEFNQYIYNLREDKKALIQECLQIESEIKEAQKSLPKEMVQPIPKIFTQLEPEEEPEREFIITPEQIETRQRLNIESLNLQFRMNPIPEIPQNLDAIKQEQIFEDGQGHDQWKSIEKQNSLLTKLHEIIREFRERVLGLRNERMNLAIDLKLMGIKFLVLIQELDIVKEFEAVEKSVMERLKVQKIELMGTKAKLEKVKKRVLRGEAELLKIEQSISDVQKEATVVITKNSKFSDYLWKVYKKKIKAETVHAEDDDSYSNYPMSTRGSISSSDSSSGSDSTSVDSGSDLFKLPKEKFDTNNCPQQLDKIIFDKIWDLRSKKINLELDAEAQKQVVQKIKKDFEAVEKIYKKHEGKKEDIGHEIESLRRKKQEKINLIRSVVILRAHQVLCIDHSDGSDGLTISEKMKKNFPSNLNDIIIFPKHGITALENRVNEVKQEMTVEHEKHEQARQLIKQLRDKLTKIEKTVALTEDQCKQDMIKKFGRMVDLDELCAGIINLEILKALKKVEVSRNQKYKTRESLQKKIDEVRDRLTCTTKENSTLNTLVAILTERQRNVDHFLRGQVQGELVDKVTAEAGSVPCGDLVVDGGKKRGSEANEVDLLDDIYRLEEILYQQNSRLEMLKNAVAACKSKCGLPPIVPFSLVPNEVSQNFVTVDELEYLQRRQEYLHVETLYEKSGMSQLIAKSNTNIFPSPGTGTTVMSPQNNGDEEEC